MKYWTLKTTLNKMIALKNFDRETYLHVVNTAFFGGILFGILIMQII